ncbi:MAG: ribbon-helix-helix protein, CopG family, partial [Chloroflexota bacterium]
RDARSCDARSVWRLKRRALIGRQPLVYRDYTSNMERAMPSSTGPYKRRSQIMLDEDLYHGLADAAEIEGRSISALVREAVAGWLAARRPRPVQDSPFWPLVGSAHSAQSGRLPISENVDLYLYPAPGREPNSGATGRAGEDR